MASYTRIRASAANTPANVALQVVAAAAAVDPDELLAPTRRGARIARARQVAMYTSHIVFGLSLTQVAKAFGRDRTTAAHACRVIEERRDDPAFDQWLQKLEQALRALPNDAALQVETARS